MIKLSDLIYPRGPKCRVTSVDSGEPVVVIE